MKKIINSSKDDMSFATKTALNVISGGLAGVLTDCFLYSFDFCRTQMAADLIGDFMTWN